jgi:REP element-mobilizing transposase RayT
MGYLKVWIHLVWTTKNHQPFLTKDIRGLVFKHIKENAREKGIYIDQINGYLEHVHCLISLRSDQSLDKIMMYIKGESSHWINQQKLVSGHFGWQNNYWGASVGESYVGSVRSYIRNQEKHHVKKTFGEEYKRFLNDNGFDFP